MNPSSIVITGSGAVCGAGRTPEVLWEAVLSGKISARPIAQWDASAWPQPLAVEVAPSELRTLVDDRRVQKMVSRTDLFGLCAATGAFQSSGLDTHRKSLAPEALIVFNERSGVFAGSGGGNYRSSYEFFPLMTAAAQDPTAFGRELETTVDPMWLLRQLPNNVVCHVGIRHTFRGTNACITNHAVGGALAISEAASAIEAGEADRAIAIGHDAPLEPETLLHFERLGLLTKDMLRPFDRHRTGTQYGEGAAAVMLERAGDATARGATILGEWLGFGFVTEGTGILDVRPDGDGMARAILSALNRAGLRPEDVGMVVAHGSGTPASDASEALALQRVFGPNVPPVTAFKWALGHSMVASGALDLVVLLQALKHRVVPGIATLRELDPVASTLPISAAPQTPLSDVALLCSRGFGGMNLAMLVRRPGAVS